jgi:hypothetical protein
LGDSVGVVTSWKWPDPLEGVTAEIFDKVAAEIRSARWRKHPQATAWVGKAVAKVMGLNINGKKDHAKIVGIVDRWINAGSLKVVEGLDDKGMSRDFVELAE